MATHKKWCIRTIVLSSVFILAIAGIIIIIDPYFHYRRPFEKLSFVLADEAHQNPGIARNFKYDSLVAGSSMAENFKTSYFEKSGLGTDVVKTTFSGASTKNLNVIIEIALRNNPNLKTVYIGMDQTGLKREVDVFRPPLPMYLCDENLVNDVSYILNKNSLEHAIISISNTISGIPSTTFDEYSKRRSREDIFSQYAVVAPYFDTIDRGDWLDLLIPKGVDSDESNDAAALAFEHISTNFIPLIEKYPDTEFVIFYPPYSIIYWLTEKLDVEIGILERIIETLMQYDNVSQYFFMNDPAIITNLYIYRDAGHYNSDINDYMVDCFANGRYRLTADNFKGELAKMESLVRDFDFGLFSSKSNPFIRETRYGAYLEKLCDPRYIAFIAAKTDVPISAGVSYGSLHEQLGIDLSGGNGLVGVVKGGEVLYQGSSDGALGFDDVVSGVSVKLLSEKRNDENYIEVIINEIVYTSNQEGINIVVYDTQLGCVLDNIAVGVNSGIISRR